MKIRDQSIQTQRQEIVVCIYYQESKQYNTLFQQNYEDETKKQRQLLQTLERERDRYGKEASDAQQSCISQV